MNLDPSTLMAMLETQQNLMKEAMTSLKTPIPKDMNLEIFNLFVSVFMDEYKKYKAKYMSLTDKELMTKICTTLFETIDR